MEHKQQFDPAVPILDRKDVAGAKPVTAEEWATARHHGYATGKRGNRRMLVNGGAAGTILVPVVVLPPAAQGKEPRP